MLPLVGRGQHGVSVQTNIDLLGEKVSLGQWPCSPWLVSPVDGSSDPLVQEGEGGLHLMMEGLRSVKTGTVRVLNRI